MSRDAITEYARSRGLDVSRTKDAQCIVADAAPYRVEVVVPDSACEWFITVKDEAGREVFTDWCEHDVEADLAAEVVGFLSLIGPGRLRVVATRAEAARLEVSYQGAWIDPWDITDAPAAAS